MTQLRYRFSTRDRTLAKMNFRRFSDSMCNALRYRELFQKYNRYSEPASHEQRVCGLYRRHGSGIREPRHPKLAVRKHAATGRAGTRDSRSPGARPCRPWLESSHRQGSGLLLSHPHRHGSGLLLSHRTKNHRVRETQRSRKNELIG